MCSTKGPPGAHGTQERDAQRGESQNDSDGGNDLRSSSCDFISLCFFSAPTALNESELHAFPYCFSTPQHKGSEARISISNPRTMPPMEPPSSPASKAPSGF